MNLLALSYNPRLLWRLLLLALPVWALLAWAGLSWVSGWPLPQESVTVPEPAQRGFGGEIAPAHLNRYSVVWTRPLRQKLIEQKEPEPPPPVEQERRVSLALMGTAVEGPQSYALLRREQGQVSVVEVGGWVDSFRVQTIESGRVGLLRDGATTYLTLPESMRRLLPEGSEVAIGEASDAQTEGASLQDHAADPGAEPAESIRLSLPPLSSTEFLDQVRFVPALDREGEQLGFRLDSLSRSGAVGRAGLQPGDVVRSVDGQALRGLGDLGRLLDSLDSASGHQWQVLRGRRVVEVQVNPMKQGE